jgi:Capsule polysaccharide biosynthesis protein
MDRRKLIRAGDWAYFREVRRIYAEDPEDYLSYTPSFVLGQRLGRVFRARFATRHFSRPHHQSDRFVLFPLHVQPEATTLTLAPFLVDQPTLVANIAKSLPVGYLLYVKEHAYAVGRRHLAEYARMAACPNVRLISAEANVHDLVPASAAVATITGTMGLEALIYGRPSITFARPFYVASGLTHEVGDMRELPHVMRRAIFENHPDQERLVTFLAAALDATYPGMIGYEKVSPPEAMSEQNISAVADAFAREISTCNSKGSVLE